MLSSLLYAYNLFFDAIFQSKLRSYEGNNVPEIEEPDHSESSISSRGRNSHSYNSPSFSDDEMTGRYSPFHLDR